MDALRSALQPITQNLPKPIQETGVTLLGKYCYKTLILDIDPAKSPECVKLAVSKGLGIGIIGASSIVKIPQLLKLINSQSAEGISFLSYLLETSSYLISLAYNVRRGFPFSTYGETALIMVQNVAIAALVLHYTGKSAGAAVWVAGLAAAGYALFDSSIVDPKTMAVLQAGAGVLGIASKAPQIVANYELGGTGQLSAFAVWRRDPPTKVNFPLTYAGLQLPSRFAVPHLHHSSGGQRPPGSVRIRFRLCSQLCSGLPDGLLLEQPLWKEDCEQEDREAHCRCSDWCPDGHVDCHLKQDERSQHQA